MNKVPYSIKKTLFSLILSVFFLIQSCIDASYLKREIPYYTDKSNYVTAEGIVSHIVYNDRNTRLYLSFHELTVKFSDVNFKIVGKNFTIVKENGIDEKISVGTRVSFISAPRFFGDGYCMPIVQLSINGEELLNFEDGYANLLEWLEAGEKD